MLTVNLPAVTTEVTAKRKATKMASSGFMILLRSKSFETNKRKLVLRWFSTRTGNSELEVQTLISVLILREDNESAEGRAPWDSIVFEGFDDPNETRKYQSD